jgi:TolB protein
MTEIPELCPLPKDAFERQRALLGVHVASELHRSPRRRWRVVAIAVAIVAGAALLVTPAFSIGDRLLALIEGAPARPEVQSPVWSPDGRRIAFVSRRDGKALYVMNADGSGLRIVARVRQLATPAWSPDGRRIAFQGGRDDHSGAVYVVNADGSGQRTLARRGNAPAWSPDGRRIAFESTSKLYVVNADGTGSRTLTRLPSGQPRSLAWSPDGRKLAFLSEDGCGQFCFHVIVMNADGSNVRDLTPHLRGGPGLGAADPAWSPDGRTIAYVRRASPAWSRPGTMLVVKPDGSGQRRLTWVPADYSAAAWSPDGRKLAFVSDRDDNSEVYVMHANASGQRNLTRNPAFDADPAWSPDGRSIAFRSTRDGNTDIYIMNADGSGQRNLTRSPANEGRFAWAPGRSKQGAS